MRVEALAASSLATSTTPSRARRRLPVLAHPPSLLCAENSFFCLPRPHGGSPSWLEPISVWASPGAARVNAGGDLHVLISGRFSVQMTRAVLTPRAVWWRARALVGLSKLCQLLALSAWHGIAQERSAGNSIKQISALTHFASAQSPAPALGRRSS